MSVCGITRGMNLCILRILWLVVQRIIKVEIVSLSPLIISTALICLLSTFHWALKPGWRLSSVAAPVLDNSGNAEKAMKTFLCPKKSPAAALCSSYKQSVDVPKSCGGSGALCLCSPHFSSAGVSHTPTGISHPEEFLGATNPEQGAGWGCGVLVILVGGIPVKKLGCLSSPARTVG